MAFAYSPWTEGVMLYSSTAPSWFVWLLFRHHGYRKVIPLFILTLLWTVLMYAVVRFGVDRPLFGDNAARTLIISQHLFS